MSEDDIDRILDTMTVSALMEGVPRTIDRLEAVERTHVLLPQPVVAEIRFGLERLPRSKRRARLEARFDGILRTVARAPWTDDVSACFGRIKASLRRAGRAIEDFDIAIAAHAVARDAILVTSNVEHMARVRGILLEDWTAAPDA